MTEHACIAHIRRNSDGVVRQYACHWLVEEPYDNSQEFMWSEGNFSCDCNRCDFFMRAGNEECIEQPCGNTAYTIEKIVLDDGTIVYEED